MINSGVFIVFFSFLFPFFQYSSGSPFRPQRLVTENHSPTFNYASALRPHPLRRSGQSFQDYANSVRAYSIRDTPYPIPRPSPFRPVPAGNGLVATETHDSSRNPQLHDLALPPPTYPQSPFVAREAYQRPQPDSTTCPCGCGKLISGK